MRIDINELSLAWQALEQGRHRDAVRRSAGVLTAQPNNASALACHGMANWRGGGNIDLCIDELERAVAIAPRVASLWHNLATLQASKGDGASATSSFTQALTLKPHDTQAFYSLCQNTKFVEETALLRSMTALYESGLVADADREFLCFGLAKAFDDLGEYDRAIKFCLEANALANRFYDPAPERQALAELTELVGQDKLRGQSNSDHASSAPLFIVGLPRSGTTLIESILSRHSQVHAAGEVGFVPEVERRLLSVLQASGFSGQRNAALAGLPVAALNAGADWIIGQVGASTSKPFTVFTDKLPENSLRLGLIAKIFPHAKVIYARRHPLDCAVSNLFMRFSSGQGFTFRQDFLGERIRQVADTMALWRQGLDLPVLDVSYERLVAEPELQSRRILAFAGLDWDDACLRPQDAGHRILTASQWQVRQPIFTSSSGRWRNYRPWLDPLVDAMGGQAWVDQRAKANLAAGA